MARTKTKSGPKTVYRRTSVGTWRVSELAKSIVRANAKRTTVKDGEFVEHLIRTRSAQVTRDEIARLKDETWHTKRRLPSA